MQKFIPLRIHENSAEMFMYYVCKCIKMVLQKDLDQIVVSFNDKMTFRIVNCKSFSALFALIG